MLDNLHVVTIASEPLFYFHHLHKSCRNHGINLDVIRSMENPHNRKWAMIRDYLDNMANSDIVCYVDGFDTICVKPLYELLERFVNIQQHHQCKLILSHHHKLQYDIWWPLCYEKTCQNTYINHGTCIGYVRDWKQVLDILIDYEMSDHDAIVTYGNLYPHDILIDMRAQLFLCISNSLREIDDYVDIDSQQTVTYEEEQPFFIHATKCTYLTEILRKLGYTVDDTMHGQIRNKYILSLCKDANMYGIVCFYLVCGVFMYIAYLEIVNIRNM